MANFEAIIKDLIKDEVRAARLYNKFSLKNIGEFKQTCINMRAEEMKHARKLKSLLLSRRSFVLPDDLIHNLAISDEKSIGENARIKDFFVFALEWEQASLEIYERFRDISKEISEINLFDELAHDERTHMYKIIGFLHDIKGTD